MAEKYAHPEVLVSTDWVAAHLEDPAVRLLESDEDVLLYDTGHLPGTLKLDWVEDLNDSLVRDYIGQDAMERLLRNLHFSGKVSVVVQNGTVLKSGYEEGYFRQPEPGMTCSPD